MKATNMSCKHQEVPSQTRKKEPYVFIPNLNEVIGGRLRLRYSTVNNTYYRDYDETISPNTGNFKANWESVVFESSGIQQYRNETHDELYLDRKVDHNEGFLSWKFDLTASGLIVDTVQVKVEAVQHAKSKIKLHVQGDDVKVSTSLPEEVNISKMKELEGCSTLTIGISITAEEPGSFSKLFLQSTAARKFDCPLDINIRLKRPKITVGRSLLLLGLMYSREQLIDLHKRPWKRRPQSESEPGFLYIHVYEAKRLPLRSTGALPDPQVKCKLLVGDRSITSKTLRVKKTVDPVWDEQHVIEGIPLETIKSARLELKVVHDVISFNKSKRREVLGTATLDSASRDDLATDQEDLAMKGFLSADMSFTKLNEADRVCNSRKSNYEEDMLDILINGSRNEDTKFGENFSETSLNKHISVSLTSLQSAAQNSICDIDEEGKNTRKSQIKWKGLGKVLGRSPKQSKNRLNIKRPSIVLSNSQETIVVLDVDSNISQSEETSQLSSSSDFLVTENGDEQRRTTLTPTINHGNPIAMLEPFEQLQQTAKLASMHWDKTAEYKEEWLYCWHPLTLK